MQATKPIVFEVSDDVKINGEIPAVGSIVILESPQGLANYVITDVKVNEQNYVDNATLSRVLSFDTEKNISIYDKLANKITADLIIKDNVAKWVVSTGDTVNMWNEWLRIN